MGEIPLILVADESCPFELPSSILEWVWDTIYAFGSKMFFVLLRMRQHQITSTVQLCVSKSNDESSEDLTTLYTVPSFLEVEKPTNCMERTQTVQAHRCDILHEWLLRAMGGFGKCCHCRRRTGLVRLYRNPTQKR